MDKFNFSEPIEQPRQYFGGNKLVRRQEFRVDDNNYENEQQEQKKSNEYLYLNSQNEPKKPKSKKSSKQKKQCLDLNKISDINEWDSNEIVSDNGSTKKSSSAQNSLQQVPNHQIMLQDIEQGQIIDYEDFQEDIFDNEYSHLNVQEIFEEIIRIRNYQKYLKSQITQDEEKKLLKIAKRKYSEIISQQIGQKTIEVDLHFITKDNVLDIIEFCTTEIINNKEKMYISNQFDRPAINIHFITGEGSQSLNQQ